MDDKFLMALLLIVLIFILVLIIRNTFVAQVRKPLMVFAYVLSGALVAIIIYKMPAIFGFVRSFLNSHGFNI
ncbi:MAG TPA: hypothetical protein DCZ94_19500 [Lentisphaeria bacterium]|nr:MAG: hypothetical protein A2X48_07645 [Lentisphaerae bacterium GWF2_49_21]HBC89130.1 hypothetical protein [Lentisphaeria bacterium]